MKALTKRIVLALVVALIVLGAFVGLSVYRVRRQAAILLSEFRELGTSTNPSASFDRFKQKYSAEIQPLEGCTPKECQYEMIFSNKALSFVHVVPYTEMHLYFTKYEGELRSAMLDYRAALTSRESPTVHIEQGLCAKRCVTRFDVSPHGISRQMWSGLVVYDWRATPEQENAALTLNLSCLAKLGGCKDIVDLLPTMWSRNSPNTVSSRLVGLLQELEESHRFLSPDDL